MDLKYNNGNPLAIFEYKGREFHVWNNGMYFAIMNSTKGFEYHSKRWFVIKELASLYDQAVKLVATVDP
jgi:hypothetical protein